MFWKTRKKQDDNGNKTFPSLKKENKTNFSLENLSIISYLKDGILIFDKNDKLFAMNPQAEKFLNIKKEKVLGKSVLGMTYSPSLRRLVSFLGVEITETNQKELQLDENLILETSSVQIKNQKDKMASLVILHDITKEKMSQEIKSRFIALAAHQLRTPSSAVKWSMKMLLAGEMGELTLKQKETIEKTYKTNEKMIALINDLLDITKIEEGRYISKKVLADILEVIKSAIELSQDMIDRKSIKFSFKTPRMPIPKIMLDKERMKMAIGNILDNAVKYTPAKGKISILLKIKKEEVEIQIKDNGIGIPYNEQKNMFNIFHRGSNASKVDTEGTGLGLFVAKNIIEAHEGAIWFHSRVNKGTIFYLTVPIKEEFSEFLREDLY
jgi:PAS domain S-box-containing protein